MNSLNMMLPVVVMASKSGAIFPMRGIAFGCTGLSIFIDVLFGKIPTVDRVIAAINK